MAGPSAVALALLVTMSLAPTSGATAQAAFFSNVEDLPLMPGLREVVEEGMVFDKPEGRIVEAVAVGAIHRTAVAAFYDAALPQLGWDQTATATFARSGEVLRYRLEVVDGETAVRVSIAPD